MDEASQAAEVIVPGYGLCSLAVVGLRATTAAIVVSRSDDCTAIFLGSCDAHRQQARKEPGTYYLTKGWIEVGDTPFSEYAKLVEKYGAVRALRMMKLTLKNYTRLAFINRRGRLVRDVPHVRKANRGYESLLVPGEHSSTGRDIVMTQKDINEIQLAKGAIATGLETLLEGGATLAVALGWRSPRARASLAPTAIIKEAA